MSPDRVSSADTSFILGFLSGRMAPPVADGVSVYSRMLPVIAGDSGRSGDSHFSQDEIGRQKANRQKDAKKVFFGKDAIGCVDISSGGYVSGVYQFHTGVQSDFPHRGILCSAESRILFLISPLFLISYKNMLNEKNMEIPQRVR